MPPRGQRNSQKPAPESCGAGCIVEALYRGEVKWAIKDVRSIHGFYESAARSSSP